MHFETSGEISEQTYTDLGFALFSRKPGRMLIVCEIVLAMYMILLWIIEGSLLPLMGLAFLLLANGSLWFTRKRTVKIMASRMKESSPTGTFLMRSGFTDEGVLLKNETTGGSSVLAYNTIVRYAETAQVIAFFTKANQFFCVFKNGLEDENAFWEFMRAQPTQIKWKAKK